MSVVIARNESNTFEDIRQILIHEMSLDPEKVNIFNQRIDPELLKQEGLFIYIDCLPSKVISSRSRYEVNALSGEYEEIQDLNQHDPIVIGIFSKNLEALTRKDEVVMALSSTYAQQVQERGSFKIFRDAPIEDLSQLEGAALLYRYDIPVVLHTWTRRVKKVDFYNVFKGQVKVNDGLPLVTQDFDQPTSES